MTKENPKEILIRKLISKEVKTPTDLGRIKREVAKKFKVSTFSNVALLKEYHKLLKDKEIKSSKITEELLRKRPIRSLSGIVNVSVLTKPYPCPGKCVFCPIEKSMPKSYLEGEPAADRARALSFDPYLQTKKRIEQLLDQGHPVDKVELRIIGGTWSFYPKQYQSWFITRCFAACNAKLCETERETTRKVKSLKEEQKINEKAKRRIVGISIETRPDFVTKGEVLRLRKLGVTMVELGVQSVFDEVLKKCRTGLTAEKIAHATRLLREAGFKILFQVMPNLPSSNQKKDLELFRTIFEHEDFKPDWLKIYPCLVCKNTLIYDWWKKKQYKSYSDKELIELLSTVKKNLPYWTRVTRIFRDIPSYRITAGSKVSNLREVVQREMKQKGLSCRCVRCREVKERYDSKEKAYLFREDYPTSDGKEIFLSFENEKRTKLYSLLRLRVSSFAKATKDRPSFLHFIPVLQGTAIIRELHTFGPQLPIEKNIRGQTSNISPQHKGFGRRLIKEAETLAKKEFGLSRMAVISGIGAREYYRKLGYILKDTYMVKVIE